MKKNRTNDRDQYVKAHKTPSPTSFTQLKSPRFGRHHNNLTESNKRLTQQQEKYYNFRENEQIDVFKAYLLEVKQRQNIIQNQSEGSKIKKVNKLPKNNESKKVTSDQQSYNSYFFPHQETNGTEKKNKNYQTNNSISRKSSISKEGSEKGLSSKNSYQETVRKLANQNIRLRHECKVMQEKYEKAAHQRKNAFSQNIGLKSQLEKLIKIQQQMIWKENSLMDEMKNLKKLFSTNSEQLSQSNYQIYRMKQQIFDLTLNRDKSLEMRSRGKSKPQNDNQDKFKLTAFHSQKNLPQSKNMTSSTNCKQCKKNISVIVELTNQNENLKFQLNEKSSIISSLCTEIQRLSSELKLLEKPKLIYKKFNGIINDLNDELLCLKAKDLSFKYMKVTK